MVIVQHLERLWRSGFGLNLRTKEKLELENVKKDAMERLNNQKATIMKLENELETAEDAIYQKDSEISNLKDSIYLKREEVNKNAN